MRSTLEHSSTEGVSVTQLAKQKTTSLQKVQGGGKRLETEATHPHNTVGPWPSLAETYYPCSPFRCHAHFPRLLGCETPLHASALMMRGNNFAVNSRGTCLRVYREPAMHVLGSRRGAHSSLPDYRKPHFLVLGLPFPARGQSASWSLGVSS